MIDLHTHTTASDGLCSSAELVARAAANRVAVLAVTDHDTIAGCEAARAACASAGIEFVPGIEITAFVGETDVHVLAYFIDVRSDRLSTLLQSQRASRFNRVRKIVERLASYGISLDPDAILRPAADDAGKAPGRPWIARALVAAGHVRSADEAFSLWLAEGRPGFVARSGLAPRDVFTTIHDAGGIASLAHPGLVGHDEWIPSFAKEGLDAIEAYHSEHDPLTTSRYAAMARDLSLAVSGGSDYHGDHTHGVRAPGSVSLPRDAYDRLKALVR